MKFNQSMKPQIIDIKHLPLTSSAQEAPGKKRKARKNPEPEARVALHFFCGWIPELLEINHVDPVRLMSTLQRMKRWRLVPQNFKSAESIEIVI